MAETWVDLLRLMDGSLRFAAPLILCAMAGLVSERSGIIDIGLAILLGAFGNGYVPTACCLPSRRDSEHDAAPG